MLIFNHLYTVLAFNPTIGASASDFCLHAPALRPFHLTNCNKIKHNPFWHKVPGAVFCRPFNQIRTCVTFYS